MLDRFLAQAQRHAARRGVQFAGVAVEVDTAGTLSLNAAGLERLVLCPKAATALLQPEDGRKGPEAAVREFRS
jgi:hypothetical protein